MQIPKRFDVNTHGSLVRFLIKFVKEFNDLEKPVVLLTKIVENSESSIEVLFKENTLLSDRIGALEELVEKRKKR